MRHATLLITSLAMLLTSPVFAQDARPPRPARVAEGEAPPRRIPAPVSRSSVPPGETVPIASVPARVRRAVVADAARRFQIAESAVVLARAEQVTWSDGSLGCPQPGRMYTQALVPGYRLVAKSAQGEFLYHADSHGNVMTCGPAPGETPREAFKKSKPVQPGTQPPAAPER